MCVCNWQLTQKRSSNFLKTCFFLMSFITLALIFVSPILIIYTENLCLLQPITKTILVLFPLLAISIEASTTSLGSCPNVRGKGYHNILLSTEVLLYLTNTGNKWLWDFSFFHSSIFVYNPILMNIFMDANIIKTLTFH